jgi:hypothetical protein
MNATRPLLITLALLTLSVFSMTTATAEQFPTDQPPWYSYGPKPENNNPYDFSGDRSSFPNGNAGYAGAELPLSEYNPDKPRYPQNDRTAPMPPLDNGMYSRNANPWCSGEYCGRP